MTSDKDQGQSGVAEPTSAGVGDKRNVWALVPVVPGLYDVIGDAMLIQVVPPPPNLSACSWRSEAATVFIFSSQFFFSSLDVCKIWCRSNLVQWVTMR